jgi:DNA replication protein DnaC
LGAAGVGKTYFCSALIPWVYNKIQYFRYWKEREFLSRIRDSMNYEKSSYVEQIKQMCDDHFMILDDLGSSGFNEWRKEVFFEAIDTRYETRLPTVFTSNLTRSDLREGLGSRVASRLFAKENLIIELHDANDLRESSL